MSESFDDDRSDASDSVGRPAMALGAAHLLMMTSGAAVVAMLAVVWIGSAKARLLATPPAAPKAVAVAAPTDMGFCSDGFKTVLRRVLDSCGLLTANSRKGCSPSNLKQVAAISDTDFVALFNPVADRAGILTFEQGKEELSPAALALLEKKWTDARGASVFLVVARASPEGSTDANQALSHKRANSVLFHLQQKFNDPELEQKVGLLWLGEEYAQLSADYCKWEHAGGDAECGVAEVNRSTFVAWIDCNL